MQRFSSAAIGALVLGAIGMWSAAVLAQSFPNRPLKIIVPVPPGGGVDFLSRAIGQKISESVKQAVVIDNRPGASAAIGTELLAKSPADGYTLMMGYSAHATNPIFNPKLPYDTLKDFTAIVHVGYIPLLLVVHPSLPVKSLKELVALAKAKPGQLQYASGGAGAGAHLSGELLKSMAKVDLIHVPYKGNAPALNDVLGGQVPMMFDTITTCFQHVQSGRLRMLAVTSSKRAAAAPDAPTMAEAGLSGFEVSAWYVMFVPAQTPRQIVAQLNEEVNKALRDASLRSRLSAQGVELVGGKPEFADNFVRAEMSRWAKIIKATGMSGN